MSPYDFDEEKMLASIYEHRRKQPKRERTVIAPKYLGGLYKPRPRVSKERLSFAGEQVMDAVQEVCGLTRAELLSPSHQGKFCRARFLVGAVLVEHYGYSLSRIARMLGMHHTSVMHGVHRVATDESLQVQCAQVMKVLQSDVVQSGSEAA